MSELVIDEWIGYWWVNWLSMSELVIDEWIGLLVPGYDGNSRGRGRGGEEHLWWRDHLQEVHLKLL